VAFTFLGNVTTGEIKINNEGWGNISDWKNKYDNAIGNLLAGHESEHALAAL
jgi:phosphoribosylformylglycinamidine synthase